MSSQDRNVCLKKEAVWTISNMCHIINDKEAIKKMIYADVVTLFYNILVYEQESGQIQILSLSGLDNLMTKSDQARQIFEKIGGSEVLEKLQISPFHEVYKLASDMLERHFGGAEMDELEKGHFINQN